MKKDTNGWINFRDKLPQIGRSTLQREFPDTPKKEYSTGTYCGHSLDNPEMVEYLKTAQWKYWDFSKDYDYNMK